MKYLLEGQETKRLRFCPVSLDQFDQWLLFFKDQGSHQYWKRIVLEPEVECQHWYDRQFNRYQNEEGGMNALIEKTSGLLVGHAGLLMQHIDDLLEMEVAYSLVPAFWSKGFATEAAIKCRDFAFENSFAPSLISIISTTNLPSAAVALRNGMRADKSTNYHDNAVNIFRITRADWVAGKNPSFPT